MQESFLKMQTIQIIHHTQPSKGLRTKGLKVKSVNNVINLKSPAGDPPPQEWILAL